MLKKYKTRLILSSVVILLPTVFGVVFWNKLPDLMTTHWNANGVADGWSSKAFAVFAIPCILLAVHLLCVLVTAIDPKNKEQNGKVFGMVLWISPLLSCFVSAVVYAASLGKSLNAGMWTIGIMGLMFVVIGNYLPKCKQNYTIGIKVKWALNDEENWNATHRFAGKVWVIGGVLLCLCAFLPESVFVWVMVAILAVLAVIPIIYSYMYYKKQIK